MRIAGSCALVLMGWLCLPAQAADVVKCRAADGSVIYTQGQCPAGSTDASAAPGTDSTREDCADGKLSFDVILACSRARKLQANQHWIQVDERKRPDDYWGRFVCTREVAFPDPSDPKLSALSKVVLEVKLVPAPAGARASYSVSLVDNRTFATPEQAATAGCRNAYEQFKGAAVH